MESNGKAKDTIKSITKALMFLARNCNLNQPEQVTSFIAKHNVSNGTKEAYSHACRKYCKYHKIQAEIPFYQPDPKPTRLPAKEKLLIFMTNTSKRLSTKITLSMETGLEPIELHNLKVKNIDLDQRLFLSNNRQTWRATITQSIHTARNKAARTHNQKTTEARKHDLSKYHRTIRQKLQAPNNQICQKTT